MCHSEWQDPIPGSEPGCPGTGRRVSLGGRRIPGSQSPTEILGKNLTIQGSTVNISKAHWAWRNSSSSSPPCSILKCPWPLQHHSCQGKGEREDGLHRDGGLNTLWFIILLVQCFIQHMPRPGVESTWQTSHKHQHPRRCPDLRSLPKRILHIRWEMGLEFEFHQRWTGKTKAASEEAEGLGRCQKIKKILCASA